MIRKFKITYRVGHKLCTVELEASSKYNAKQRFYIQFPKGEIVKMEADNEQREKDDDR